MRVDSKGNPTIGRHFERLLALIERNWSKLDEMDRKVYGSERYWYYNNSGDKGKTGGR